MKVCLSSFAFTPWTIERAIEKTAELGFGAIEVSANRPHMLPEDYPPGERRRIVTLAASLDVSFSAVTSCNGTAQWHLTHPNPLVRRAAVRHVVQCVDLAADLGARIIEVVSGRPVMEAVPDKDMVAWLKEGLGECADHAASSQKVIALEAEPGNYVKSVGQAARLADEVRSPGIGILADVGHMNLSGEDVASSIEKAGRRIAHVHLHDNDSSKDQHLIPGEGRIDFPRTIGALRKVGYGGYLSLELLQVSKPESIIGGRKLIEGMIA